jgi:hypothetical protein
MYRSTTLILTNILIYIYLQDLKDISCVITYYDLSRDISLHLITRNICIDIVGPRTNLVRAAAIGPLADIIAAAALAVATAAASAKAART